MKAILIGKDFKELVAAVRRFPSLGSFAGAGLVSFSVELGKATATHLGIAASRARVPATGELPITAIDERIVDGFAPLCADDAKVTLSREGNELLMKCRDREVRPVVSEAVEHKFPSLKEITGIKISEEVAPRLAYLSEVAHSDTSRAELCCVMMTDVGEIVASSQKIIAVLKGEKLSQNIAVPLPLAKAILAGDSLYPGARETVIRTGTATYVMPAPVKAQKEFPIDKIREFGNSGSTDAATVAGDKLASVLTDCQSCLSRLAAMEIIVDITVADKLYVSATSGTTIFKGTVPLLAKHQEAQFRAPLSEMYHITPFFTQTAVLSVGKHGDLFVKLPIGWCWLPAWIKEKK